MVNNMIHINCSDEYIKIFDDDADFSTIAKINYATGDDFALREVSLYPIDFRVTQGEECLLTYNGMYNEELRNKGTLIHIDKFHAVLKKIISDNFDVETPIQVELLLMRESDEFQENNISDIVNRLSEINFTLKNKRR